MALVYIKMLAWVAIGYFKKIPWAQFIHSRREVKVLDLRAKGAPMWPLREVLWARLDGGAPGGLKNFYKAPFFESPQSPQALHLFYTCGYYSFQSLEGGVLT